LEKAGFAERPKTQTTRYLFAKAGDGFVAVGSEEATKANVGAQRSILYDRSAVAR
jgi:hypothetical protein